MNGPFPLAILGLGLLLTVGAAVQGTAYAGVHGIKSNDTGGIIPWSPENQAAAFAIASERCARFNKYARINSVQAQYGDYIGFSCVWSPYARP
jgi:hypothetical protein